MRQLPVRWILSRGRNLSSLPSLTLYPPPITHNNYIPFTFPLLAPPLQCTSIRQFDFRVLPSKLLPQFAIYQAFDPHHLPYSNPNHFQLSPHAFTSLQHLQTRLSGSYLQPIPHFYFSLFLIINSIYTLTQEVPSNPTPFPRFFSILYLLSQHARHLQALQAPATLAQFRPSYY